MSEWIRFGVCAFFVLVALICFVTETLGIYRFRRMLPRLHAAAIGDTIGMLAAVIAAVTARGGSFASFKLLAVWIIMAVAAPVTAHLLARLECLRADKGNIQMQQEKEGNSDEH